MNTKALKFSVAASLVIGLAACGGGGDSGSGAPEGLWGGYTSDGVATALFVLDDGQTWGVYGSEADGFGGILQGSLNSTGNAVSGSLLDFSLTSTSQSSLSVTGTANAGSSLNLQIDSDTAAGLNFDSAYNTPASLAQIAGTYTGIAAARGIADDSVVVVIDAFGQVSTSSTAYPQCVGTGQVSLRSGNKAIVNFTIAFAGTGCLFAIGSSMSGVGVYEEDSIVAIGMNTSKTQGLLLVADKAGVP
jgi:hypothetical protein